MSSGPRSYQTVHKKHALIRAQYLANSHLRCERSVVHQRRRGARTALAKSGCYDAVVVHRKTPNRQSSPSLRSLGMQYQIPKYSSSAVIFSQADQFLKHMLARNIRIEEDLIYEARMRQLLHEQIPPVGFYRMQRRDQGQAGAS